MTNGRMTTCAAAVLSCLATSGCGGSAGDDGDDGGELDGGGLDGGGDADGNGGGGDGGAGGDAFRVTGSVPANPTLRRGAAEEGARVVDHVVAVAPSSQSQVRVLSPVGADGRFSLDIDTDHPWVLVFVDSSRVGADMIAGVLGAGSLDALRPTSSGDLDLGEIDVPESGEATAGISYDELLAGLGLDPAAADYLGALDDLCLRYVNPDIDANGVLDALEPSDHRFLLDFHVQRAMREAGGPATVADLVGRFLDPVTTTSSFLGTGVYVSVPAAFWSGSTDEASMVFDGVLRYWQPGGAGGEPAIASAGTAVGGDDLIGNDFGDMRGVGVHAAAGFELPQGSYEANLGGATLTFTSVATLTDAALASAEGTLLPFVRFAPVEIGCVDSCAIASIDVEWRKRTAGGWILATDDELSITVGDSGGYASIVVGSETGTEHIGFTLPSSAPTGSVLWQAASAHLEGVDEAAFALVTTDQICHFGLSYDDRLGMRHFAGLGNAPGTCL